MKTREVDSVFLCRTPLQARICLRIIEELDLLNFDLIYFTQNDSLVDKYYFSMLSANSKNSIYIFVKKQKKDILNHLLSIFYYRRKSSPASYKNIYLASIDSYLFRYVISKNSKAALFGFDDGSANISQWGIYYDLDACKKTRLYTSFLRLPSIKSVKYKLIRHYSIYSDFDNIVSRDKLYFLSLFSKGNNNQNKMLDKVVKYFIGQPFFEYLEPKEIEKLKKWVEAQSIDYYIMHPREETALVHSIPILKTKGLLAEDAMFESAGDARVCIISAYSTVLFNVSSEAADKIYLSLNNDSVEQKRCALIEKTGSKIINIYEN